MIQDYDGARVLDAMGEPIGTVEQSYDDASGVTRFVEVKMGTVFAKHRLVPIADAQVAGGDLRVPFSKEQIQASPDAKAAADTLDGDLMDQVRTYYDSLVDNDQHSAVAAVPANRTPKQG